jgi:hypothetical protein
LVTYPATLDLPGELVSFVENVVATRRGELRSPWRVLTSFDRAVPALVWLRGHDSPHCFVRFLDVDATIENLLKPHGSLCVAAEYLVSPWLVRRRIHE